VVACAINLPGGHEQKQAKSRLIVQEKEI